jgi:DNA-binding LytR/AlgR family response regulator
MKLRCIVVDDEPLARQGLSEYIQDLDFLSYSGAFQNALEASDYLKQNEVDLMFLDIRMPKLSGVDFLKKLETPPLVIFTTAYTEYAIESYELNVIDYLVKPISFGRCEKAVQKAHDYFSFRVKSNPQAEYCFIKANQKIEKLFFNEILYVEAMQNYCIIYTGDKKLITYSTLTAMIEKLPTHKFMKVHKSYVVAVDKVNALSGNELNIGQALIPVSRTLKNEVIKKISGKV